MLRSFLLLTLMASLSAMCAQTAFAGPCGILLLIGYSRPTFSELKLRADDLNRQSTRILKQMEVLPDLDNRHILTSTTNKAKMETIQGLRLQERIDALIANVRQLTEKSIMAAHLTDELAMVLIQAYQNIAYQVEHGAKGYFKNFGLRTRDDDTQQLYKFLLSDNRFIERETFISEDDRSKDFEIVAGDLRQRSTDLLTDMKTLPGLDNGHILMSTTRAAKIERMESLQIQTRINDLISDIRYTAQIALDEGRLTAHLRRELSVAYGSISSYVSIPFKNYFANYGVTINNDDAQVIYQLVLKPTVRPNEPLPN